MVTVPAPKTYKILSIALNGSNMVSVLSHDTKTCACTAWTSLHRLDLLDLRHLLRVLVLVHAAGSAARLHMRGCSAC